MELRKRFKEATSLVRSLPFTPTNEDFLELYSFYKQAKEGDAHEEMPFMFDMIGRAKYSAWAEVRGMTPADAMQNYISKANRLLREQKVAM